LLLAGSDAGSQCHFMKSCLTFLLLLLTLASCVAPVAKDKPTKEPAVTRCSGCGRVIKSPQDMRGEMCSMCDWRLGANIGWP
jgi:hypothetical protein